MHITMNGHYFFLVLALVLAILATLGIPGGPRFNLFAGSFAAYLIALFFT